MAAAPHLFDDGLNASPELALVDLDLAAKLRADIRTGDEFRPREVARPEFRLLLPDTPVDVEPDPAPIEATELSDDVVDADAIVVEPVLVDVASNRDAPSEVSELPDYIVLPDPGVEDLAPEVEAPLAAAELTGPAHPAFLVVPEPEAVDDVSELPDYIVLADDLVLEDLDPEVDASAEDEPTRSEYPVLPDLGEASDALEETDAALRKIREQLVAEESSPTRRGLRRGFTIVSGLGVVAALAVFAIDVQLGVATLPGWLGF